MIFFLFLCALECRKRLQVFAATILHKLLSGRLPHHSVLMLQHLRIWLCLNLRDETLDWWGSLPEKILLNMGKSFKINNSKFKFCKSVHHRTIQINHQPDATIFQFIILTFIYGSTCFGRFPAHHQELNDCSGSLWLYLRIGVTVVLCLWSGRPVRPRTHVDEMELRSISSTIAAGSSIVLTISDAVCTVLCSWWWAEEPPETCGAIYRNK